VRPAASAVLVHLTSSTVGSRSRYPNASTTKSASNTSPDPNTTRCRVASEEGEGRTPGSSDVTEGQTSHYVDAPSASTGPFAAGTQVIPVTAGFNYPSA